MRVRHEVVLEIYFSVFGEDGLGNVLEGGGPGHLRKARLTHEISICSVSLQFGSAKGIYNVMMLLVILTLTYSSPPPPVPL